MLRRARLFASCAIALLVVPGLSGRQTNRVWPIAEWLDAYDAGHYDALDSLKRVADPGAFVKEFEIQTDRWVKAAPPERREHRVRVAAMLCLEATHGAMLSQLRTIPPVYQTTRPLLAWGRDTLGSQPRSDFERRWLLASVDLLEGARDQSFLVSARPHGATSGGVWEHVVLALQRFPDEPRFKLAAVLANRQALIAASHPVGANVLLPSGTKEEVRLRLTATLDDLTALTADSSVAADAYLYRGVLLFHLSKLPESLTDPERSALISRDPFVTYMAHLFAGFASQAAHDDVRAVAEFEAALKILPDTNSAVTPLSVLLAGTPRHADAVAYVEASLADQHPQPDPWRLFGLGDYRFWSRDVAWLRAELAK